MNTSLNSEAKFLAPKLPTKSKAILPQKYRDQVGQEFRWKGHLFCDINEKPFIAKVLDVRLSNKTMSDVENKHKRWAGVEYLIHNPRTKQRRWTLPFKIEEIDLSKQEVRHD
tara:strand:- start:58589 stop:58924 length:336 start_codon:yes stop_codon:yes gene_type:complete